jgi:DNA sulfur modification protein DndB
MASSHPALKGRIGSTEYFLVVMPAQWVSNNLTIPSELEGWEEETIDERYQRKINWSRVEGSIAPYLASDPDRFFGSLIVSVLNHEGMEWEPLMNVAKDIPGAYKSQALQIGFLNLSGSETMVPLDGQHRLAALGCAITGLNGKGEEIKGLTPNAKVAADQVTLMLIRHDVGLARKIFNKVNRYARPTSKVDNLITSDDDFLAVLAREIASSAFVPRLVNESSNTIPAKAAFVTTLSTIYSIIGVVLAEQHISTDHLPDQPTQQLLRQSAKKFFATFVGKVKTFQRAMQNPAPEGDPKRIELREADLLMKPFVQLAAAAAVHELVNRGLDGSGIKLDDACERLNKLDWSKDNSDWQDVLLHGEKILSGETARKFASRFIAYSLGARFEAAEVKALQEDLRELLPKGSKRGLPKRLKS